MKKVLIISIAVSLFSLILASEGWTAAANPNQKGKAPAVAAKPAWEADWDRTLVEARREGRLTVYSGYGAELRQPLSKALSDKYGITLDYVTARSAEVAERVMREQQSRIYQADIVMVGTSQFQTTFRPQGVLQSFEKLLILPDVVNPKVWWRGELPWYDPDTKSYLPFNNYVIVPLAINTELVKPEDVRSWRGLLDPKWKGKIVISDPTTTGSGQRVMAMFGYGIMDWEYVNGLVKQEPMLSRDLRQITEWVARGKYAMVVGAQSVTPNEFIKAGAPLRLVVPSEGSYVSSGSGCVSHPKGSPHPNAAKIFLNFLLSREGQTLTSKAVILQSARIDVPTDNLNPVEVRQPGIKYISSEDPKFMDKEEELKKRVIEIFKPLSK